jgi:hypothetical protein
MTTYNGTEIQSTTSALSSVGTSMEAGQDVPAEFPEITPTPEGTGDGHEPQSEALLKKKRRKKSGEKKKKSGNEGLDKADGPGRGSREMKTESHSRESPVSNIEPTDAPAATVPGGRRARFPFTSLETSEEPTFPRTTQSDTAVSVCGIDETAKWRAPPRHPSLQSLTLPKSSTASADLSVSLQQAMEAIGIPNSLDELELLIDFLAKGLNMAPAPRFLDIYGGSSFDLQKEMVVHGRGLKWACDEAVDRDHSTALLGLLRFKDEGK